MSACSQLRDSVETGNTRPAERELPLVTVERGHGEDESITGQGSHTWLSV